MIRVGYVPYSNNLQHPADRRRLASWATDYKIDLQIANPLDSDLLILSNAANFGDWLKRAKQPVILDLVDAYLGENPRFIRDLTRNVVRSMRGTSNLRWITYTKHLRHACKMSDAIIVASPEQRELLLPFNNNVYVIPDDHSEVDSILSRYLNSKTSAGDALSTPHIFWEGFGFTLKHFRFMAEDLDRFLNEFNWGMYLITVDHFPRWGGYIGVVKTSKLVKQMFPNSWQSIKIIPWSLENLAEYACKSNLALIPITPSDQFANLKSENKLLSMWHLRMPTLASPTPSYTRVLQVTEQQQACVYDGNWYEKLVELSNSPKECEALADAGINYVSSHHTHKQVVKKWNEVINQSALRNMI